MNLNRFVAALVNTGLCTKAEEIADVIWLTLHWPGSATLASSPDRNGKTEHMTTGRGELHKPPDVAKPAGIPHTDVPNDPPRGAAVDNSPQPIELEQSSLYTASEGKSGTRRAHMLRVPSAPALPEALAIGRALRPFMRRIPSPVRSVLDEAASAELIAELRLLIPVFRPMPERIFDIALVIEMSAGMTVWHRTIAELERLLLRHGAFRDVRRWQIVWRTNATAQLFDAAREQRDCRAVSQAPGNRLVLVATDGASEAWGNGAWADILHDWSSLKSVAIVQLLGERLTERTPMGHPNARLMPSVPSAPNHVYLVELPPWQSFGPKPRVTVPIIFLNGDSVSRWARATMGASVVVRGLALASPEEVAIDDLPINSRNGEGETASSSARLQRFVQLATPEARELAAFLSAVPLTLPVMRLVQRVMMKKFSNEHLAEVLLGGILERVTAPDVTVDPDQVEFDFAAGVRELLQSSMTRAQLAHVLSCASAYVDAHFGQPLDFRALVEAQDGAFKLPEGALAFAHFARQALGRFRPLPEIKATPMATSERARPPIRRPPDTLLACSMLIGPLGDSSHVQIAFAVDSLTVLTVRELCEGTPVLVVEGSTRQLQVIQGDSGKDAAPRGDSIVALRPIGWGAQEYLRMGNPAPNGEVNVWVSGLTHLGWFSGVLAPRADTFKSPRAGLIFDPPDLTGSELAAAFVGAPVLLNDEVIGAVISAVRPENEVAVHVEIVESDYLRSVTHRSTPYVALISDDFSHVELIDDALSALVQYTSRFTGVERFAGMRLQTYSSTDRASKKLISDGGADASLGLVILDGMVRKESGGGARGDGSAAMNLLDWLTDRLPAVPVIVLVSSAVEGLEVRLLKRHNITALNIGEDDLNAAFSRALDRLVNSAKASKRLMTVEVGEYEARCYVEDDTGMSAKHSYQYRNATEIRFLLEQTTTYSPMFAGIPSPNWQAYFGQLGEKMFEIFFATTIGDDIVRHYRDDPYGRADRTPMELRIDIDAGSDAATRLFGLPFELAIPPGYDVPICARLPMARRIRFPRHAPVSPHTPTNANQPAARDERTLRMLFINASFRGTAVLIHEVSGASTPLNQLTELINTPDELNLVKSFASKGEDYALQDVKVMTPMPLETASQFITRIGYLLEAEKFDILHFSGHSCSLPDHGGTFLIFPDKSRDGVGRGVSMRIIEQWVALSDIRMVVLSSCSGSSPRTAIEVMKTRAESVISFRWDVSDHACVEYFEAFYRLYLKDRKSVAEAYCGACRKTSYLSRFSPIWASAILVVKD